MLVTRGKSTRNFFSLKRNGRRNTLAGSPAKILPSVMTCSVLLARNVKSLLLGKKMQGQPKALADWNHASEVFMKHANSQCHRDAAAIGVMASSVQLLSKRLPSGEREIGAYKAIYRALQSKYQRRDQRYSSWWIFCQPFL